MTRVWFLVRIVLIVFLFVVDTQVRPIIDTRWDVLSAPSVKVQEECSSRTRNTAREPRNSGRKISQSATVTSRGSSRLVVDKSSGVSVRWGLRGDCDAKKYSSIYELAVILSRGCF